MIRNRYPFRNGPVPVQLNIPPDMKPYNIATLDEEDSVEVNMYGEVVSEKPTDWWTGEPVEGLFIVLTDFLNDMEKIKDRKNVTFRINSPGGEVFAGVAIYNRMKEFTGNVTTIVDGLCASAASIIMQGAKPGNRKVCNGSLTMIHGASSFLFGYYNAKDMKESVKQINAIDKSIAEIYAKETGTDVETAKILMSNTTWMSAQDAIDKGFADEIVDTGSKVTMSINSAKNILTVNGVPMSARGLALPSDIPVVDEITAGKEPEVIENNNPIGGKEKMTLKELMEQEPDLVTQIQNEARQTAQTENQAAIDKALDDERKRLQSIDEIAGKIGDQALVDKAKYGEEKMSAADLALEALKAQKDAGASFLDRAKDDTNNSGVSGVHSAPTNSNLDDAAQAAEDVKAGANLIAGIVENK
nr:MAG TPA: Putative ATP dependent Clp protease [Caudoviricetes sp.]